jgi:uncharacterized protein (DUF2249 family)
MHTDGDGAADGAADVRLDAREIAGEPFGDISDALDDLSDGETLLLANGFEPVPLYDVLAERGFDHETERVAEGEWHVRISRA